MRTLVLLLSLLAASPSARAADVPAFEGTGRAPISGGDRVRARERALDEAFQRAVEAAIAALLGPETLTRRAADLRLKILPRARGYVTTYRVLDEGEREPGFFLVQVSAGVAADRLVRELGERGPTAAPAAPGQVRVLACASVAAPRLEEALRGFLTGRGLTAVAAPAGACDGLDAASREAGAPGAMGPAHIVRVVKLDAAIREAGARAALVAEVSPAAASSIRGTALWGSEVKLALRLVEPQGRRSAEGRGEGAGYGVSPDAAAEDAALAALPEAGAAIEEALKAIAPQRTPGGVHVRVVGVRRFAQLASVRSALERIPGVEAVEPRRFLPGAPGAIELVARTTQAPRAIVEALGRVAATYQLRAREGEGGVVIDVPEVADPVTPPQGAAP